MDRRADRRHARAVFADTAQRQAERRMDQPPRHQENQEQTGERVAVGGVAVEIESNLPNSGQVRMPCSPSEPPVIQFALLAASCITSPMPSVIMISARWRNRATMKLVR